MKKVMTAILMLGLAVSFAAPWAHAGEFKIGIMQDMPGVAKQYGPLIDLFKANGIEVKLQGYSNYPDAAMKFEKGEVDAMFAGSAVAGIMMMKKVAHPVLRPVDEEGHST